MLVKGSLQGAEDRATFIRRGNRVVAQAAFPGSLRSRQSKEEIRKDLNWSWCYYGAFHFLSF